MTQEFVDSIIKRVQELMMQAEVSPGLAVSIYHAVQQHNLEDFLTL
jgi:hypothetical protein